MCVRGGAAHRRARRAAPLVAEAHRDADTRPLSHQRLVRRVRARALTRRQLLRLLELRRQPRDVRRALVRAALRRARTRLCR
eukprot:3630333-Prymnesium_polylepis.1